MVLTETTLGIDRRLRGRPFHSDIPIIVADTKLARQPRLHLPIQIFGFYPRIDRCVRTMAVPKGVDRAEGVSCRGKVEVETQAARRPSTASVSGKE